MLGIRRRRDHRARIGGVRLLGAVSNLLLILEKRRGDVPAS